VIKLFWVLCFTSLLVAFPVFSQTLPPVVARDLNKKQVNWPKDFTAEKTILIIAFTRNQQPKIDEWVSALQLKTPGAPPWFEVPLIKNPGGLVRGFIDNGMRRGIPSAEARSHVVTVYTDKKKFMATAGLPDEDIHVVVVARDGKILGRSTGAHTVEKANVIEAALKR
jgi:hypothetical protein